MLENGLEEGKHFKFGKDFDSVRVTAPVSAIERSFSTEIHAFAEKESKSIVLCGVDSYTLPDKVQHDVRIVTGLVHYETNTSPNKRRRAQGNSPSSISDPYSASAKSEIFTADACASDGQPFITFVNPQDQIAEVYVEFCCTNSLIPSQFVTCTSMPQGLQGFYVHSRTQEYISSTTFLVPSQVTCGVSGNFYCMLPISGLVS